MRRGEKWQDRVLHLAGAVPEPSGAAALVANTMGRVIFNVNAPRVRKQDVADLDAWIDEFPAARAGQLLWLVGECFPAYRMLDDGGIVWDVFSPAEVEAEGGKILKVKGVSGKAVPLGGEWKWFRLWKPDPAFRFRAWSAHRALLDVLEAMYVHQLADTAVATSRLAGAGILYWPTSLPSIPVKDGRPEEGSREYLQQKLSEAMTDSIANRGSMDAIVPLVFFADPSLEGDHKPEHVLLERPDDAAAFASRMNAYAQRYARGVELPIESVQGMGPANHWTAWVIKEDKWRFYIAPLAELVSEALERNFVQPILMENGYAKDVVDGAGVVADGTELISKPDKSDRAIRLAQLGGFMNREAVLRETGFNPETDVYDGPEPVEEGPRLSELPVEFRDTSPA